MGDFHTIERQEERMEQRGADPSLARWGGSCRMFGEVSAKWVVSLNRPFNPRACSRKMSGVLKAEEGKWGSTVNRATRWVDLFQ